MLLRMLGIGVSVGVMNGIINFILSNSLERAIGVLIIAFFASMAGATLYKASEKYK